MDFLQRLSGSRALVLDGAIGTELEARGAPQRSDAAWADCDETHPGIVAAVHEDYVRAGADIITSITCSSGLHILEQIGLTNPVLNRRSGHSNSRAISFAVWPERNRSTTCRRCSSAYGTRVTDEGPAAAATPVESRREELPKTICFHQCGVLW